MSTPETAELVIRQSKGNKDRTAYLQHGAPAALRDWLSVRKLDTGPMFCPISQDGKITVRRLSDQAVYERFQLRARQAGLSTSFSPHDGRRTWIGNLLDAGVDIATVQQMAGHELTRPLGMTAEASDRNARLRVCCTSRGVSARPKAAPPRSL